MRGVAVAGMAWFLSAAAPAAAQTVDFSAAVGGSARVFPEAPLFAGQRSSRVSPSLTFAPKLEIATVDGAWRLVAEGFMRLDADDHNRTHADVRELGVRWVGDRVSAFAGAGQVFWGVTEVRHLVDVVNQVDAVEDLDGEDKLGQPMVGVTLESGLGVLDVYYLPWFRDRPFPAADARLRGPVPLEDEPLYASGAGGWHPGFAARASRSVASVDVGLSAFRGTSREARYVPGTNARGEPVLRPAYDVIDQVGLDAQWTGPSTLLKLEALTRGGYQERIWALTGGVERTLYGLLGGSSDLGIIAEVMLDSRGEDAPPTIFEHDVFVGGRWALNDAQDTSVLGGSSLDWRTGEVLLLLEAERRVGSSWSLEARGRWFANTSPRSFAHALRNDGHLSISLTRYF